MIQNADQDVSHNKFKAFLLVDIANAQAKNMVFADAKRSLQEYEELAKRTLNANQYTSRNLDETKALIAASQQNYKAAFKHQKNILKRKFNFTNGTIGRSPPCQSSRSFELRIS